MAAVEWYTSKNGNSRERQDRDWIHTEVLQSGKLGKTSKIDVPDNEKIYCDIRLYSFNYVRIGLVGPRGLVHSSVVTMQAHSPPRTEHVLIFPTHGLILDKGESMKIAFEFYNDTADESEPEFVTVSLRANVKRHVEAEDSALSRQMQTLDARVQKLETKVKIVFIVLQELKSVLQDFNLSPEDLPEIMRGQAQQNPYCMKVSRAQFCVDGADA